MGPGIRSRAHSADTVIPHGLRRVDYVRLLVGGERIRAELVGVGYRLPTALPVPLSYAARLIVDGTPSVTRHVAAERPVQAEKGA